MTSDPQRAQALFLAALDLDDSVARQQLLDRECAGDDTLRHRVEALLSAHDATMGFDIEPSNQSSQTARVVPSSLQPGEQIGRYKLLETVGEGGMGSVWVAQQLEPIKRKVAIKLIKAGMDSRQFLARFEAERQALALMDHPNIARVFDGGVSDRGQPFFVMELVNGLPLTKFCDEMRLSPNARLELFVPICQAVQHAHQKGIVHRDLKPANILVTVIDGKPVPKVIDFGVAKATAGKLTDESLFTGFGAVVGTLEYMSPEQASFSGEDIDTRADIYSLGVILYELLTGLRPIDSTRLRKVAMAEMIRIIQEEEPSKPSTRLSSEESIPSLAALRMTEPKKLMSLLRGELDWVVMKCLEKQRERRYETANALARDVQRYLSGEIVEARPPSASYRFAKLLHKHRTALATAATVAIALLIGSAFATWQAIKATQAERHALHERNQAVSARQSEAAAKVQAQTALRDLQKATARMAYERGQMMCEQGTAEVGLHWISRSLALVPEDASQLSRAIRHSLNFWAGQLNSFHHLETPAAWSGVVEDLAITPDGQSLLTVDAQGNVRAYELFTGKLRFESNWDAAMELQQFVRPSLCHSLDGRLIAASRGNGQVQIWNAVTGSPLGMPIEHAEPVSMLALDNLGTLLVAATGPNLHFWNVQSRQRTDEPSAFSDSLSGLEFSRDGRQLLVWDQHKIYLLDVTSRQISATIEVTEFVISHASLSSDGRYLLANGKGESESMAQFWEATSGTPIGRPMVWLDKRSQGQKCCFHPSGKVAMTSGFPIRGWEVPSGRPIGAVDSTFGAEHLAFHPTGRLLAAFGRSTERRLLDFAPLLFPTQSIPLEEKAYSLHTSPDGQSLITSTWDGMQHVYNIINGATGEKVGEAIRCETNDSSKTPIDPAFSADGQFVATPLGREGCQIWHLSTGLSKGPRITTAATVRALAFSADSQMLAIGCENGEIQLWNASTGASTGTVFRNRHALKRLCFSPDGNRLLAAGGSPGSIQGEAQVWWISNGQPAGPTLDIVGEVQDATFSADGKGFITGAFELIFWNAETSERVWTAPTLGVTTDLVLSSDGQRIVAAVQDENAVVILDTQTGQPVCAPLRHEDVVRAVDLSPDGKLILTYSEDRSARLWDAETGLALGPPWANLQGGGSACFVKNSSCLLLDGESIVRWSIASEMEGKPDLIQLAIEAATRCELSPHGNVIPLIPQILPGSLQQRPLKFGPDPYLPVWEKLQSKGGAPGLLRR